MKRLLILSLMLVALLWSVDPAGSVSTSPAVKTISAVTANATGVWVPINGMTTVVFHVCCTFSATVNFLATVDGNNAEAIGCVPMSTRSAYATSTTTRGLYQCNIVAVNTSVRADVTAYVSGTVTVTVSITSAGVS